LIWDVTGFRKGSNLENIYKSKGRFKGFSLVSLSYFITIIYRITRLRGSVSTGFSPIKECLETIFLTTETCDLCSNQQISLHEQGYLAISRAQTVEKTIYGSLSELFYGVKIYESCSHCEKLGHIKRTSQFWKAPSVLVIHLLDPGIEYSHSNLNLEKLFSEYIKRILLLLSLIYWSRAAGIHLFAYWSYLPIGQQSKRIFCVKL